MRSSAIAVVDGEGVTVGAQAPATDTTSARKRRNTSDPMLPSSYVPLGAHRRAARRLQRCALTAGGRDDRTDDGVTIRERVSVHADPQRRLAPTL